ncbi:MAG: hypothetical protein ACRDPY_35910 [Streptosporangiaceae bacterium]
MGNRCRLRADGDKRPFDLLILDEAHHVAPAAPKQRYAVDSQQTKLIRWLAPHFEHRLFLSATPHNGRRRLTTRRGRASVDLVTLLKKRLFSSLRAFAHTVGVYLETVRARTSKKPPASDEVPEWMEGFLDDVAAYDDEELADATAEAEAGWGLRTTSATAGTILAICGQASANDARHSWPGACYRDN